MSKIYEEGIQWCKHCKGYTSHRPKMDAAKNGQRVCNECDCCNYYNDIQNKYDDSKGSI